MVAYIGTADGVLLVEAAYKIAVLLRRENPSDKGQKNAATAAVSCVAPLFPSRTCVSTSQSPCSEVQQGRAEKSQRHTS